MPRVMRRDVGRRALICCARALAACPTEHHRSTVVGRSRPAQAVSDELFPKRVCQGIAGAKADAGAEALAGKETPHVEEDTEVSRHPEATAGPNSATHGMASTLVGGSS